MVTNAHTVAYFDQFYQYVLVIYAHHDCRADCRRRFPLLRKDQFKSSTEALLTGKLPEDNPAVPLINAVLALGCRLVQKRRTNDARLADQEARHYFAVASRARGHLAGAQAQASVIAVQALVAMVSTDLYGQFRVFELIIRRPFIFRLGAFRQPN
jgi:hypothetical protein